MKFKDRTDAGRELGEQLKSYAERDDVIVLGLPRGGVPVAAQVARRLHAPMDIFLVRKLGVPGHEELAFGAIASGGAQYLDRQIIQNVAITPEVIAAVIERTRRLLMQREKTYRGDREPPSLAGRTVILVDDGIATGSSMMAAIQGARSLAPRSIIVAAPVAPPSTCAALRREANDVVVSFVSDNFSAVGQFYEHFEQTTDEEVVALLQSERLGHASEQ